MDERTVDKALDAAARCTDAWEVENDDDLCNGCGYREHGGQCMTELIVDLTAIIRELQAEVVRLRSCGTCIHREVCYVVRMRREDGSTVNTPCQHWAEEVPQLGADTTPQPAAPTAPLSGEPLDGEDCDQGSDEDD